ncbi:hypothetical protein IWW55_002830 [Coemansia sp. RSA 2706]|nr:hypothetical protein IWW55_002830 [Coemansia sp. RSA 2706]
MSEKRRYLEPSQAQSEQPPIRLRLINSSRPQSGFSRATPERLHALARRPINTNKWTLFIEELNAALEKVPGSLANNVADFWVVSLVTLGMSAHARDMYADRQYNKVSEVVEKYNRAEFTEYGIVARFEMTRHEHHDSCEHSGNHSHCTHSDYAQHGFDRRNERYERRQQARRPEAVTLELVIERA